MSLENVTNALSSMYPKAIDVKNNGYVISLPFIINGDCTLSSKAIDEYMDTIAQCRACVEFTTTLGSCFKNHTYINLIDVCGFIHKMDITNKEIRFKIVDTSAGESFYVEYLLDKISTLNMIALRDVNEIIKIIKFNTINNNLTSVEGDKQELAP